MYVRWISSCNEEVRIAQKEEIIGLIGSEHFTKGTCHFGVEPLCYDTCAPQVRLAAEASQYLYNMQADNYSIKGNELSSIFEVQL